MDQYRDLADYRLIRGCIYCGARAGTRDHVPSRCLLDRPFPLNLPVVGCCESCNQSFSKDEEYFVCLIESVLCGSTDPTKFRRDSVSRIMKNSPALRLRIESARTEIDGNSVFMPEAKCVSNVLLKLARGHAAFELSQLCRDEPDHFWCGPIASLSSKIREDFDSAHVQQLFGEIGSRNYQRLQVAQVTLQSEAGELHQVAVLINDWINVQDDRYRYLAIDDVGELVIRIVVSEYLACEVVWRLE